MAQYDEHSVEISATAERCYDLVSDITQMGRLSPECTGGRWLSRGRVPAVGARFVGFNRRKLAWWCTLNRVEVAEPGREFAFVTTTTRIRWRYTFAPSDGGTTVTESREEVGPRPLSGRLFARFLLGGLAEHDDEMRAGLAASLDRLRQLAES